MGEQFEGSTDRKTWLAALFCGPLAGVIILLVVQVITVALIVATDGPAVPSSSLPTLLLSGAFFGVIVGWPITLVFGLPAHIFLYRRRSRKVGGYLLAGVFAGFASALAVLLMLSFGGDFAPDYAAATVWLSLFCFFSSVLASLLFWLIRRPDKDTLRPDKVAAMFE